jgi:2-polyprenyl-3-methyl-5-hydroxy-6-metoxy-1,4-benzoquinol methylase
VKSDLSQSGWQERYEIGKTGWDRGNVNPAMTTWMEEGQLRPCRILIPGCGRGHEAIALAKAGFDITAVDFANSAVEHLKFEFKRQGLKGNVVQSDLFAFCEQHSFDAVYEQTCLCAIDPNQWDTYQQLLACWLRPQGMLFALFMQSGQDNGPPFSCDLPAMRELFDKPTWNWTDGPVRVEHPTGMHELACVLQRTET